MFYQDEIKYGGKYPIKVVVPGGYLNVLLAEDVPVTKLEALKFFAWHRCARKMDLWGKDIDYQLYFHQFTEDATFIGESLLIHDLLDAMLWNSIEAGASVFRIDVYDEGERLKLVVSDNGRGLHPEIERRVLRTDCTQKSDASGFTLRWAALNVQKIDAEVTYLGKGLNGVGASFSITFLKQMLEGN